MNNRTYKVFAVSTLSVLLAACCSTSKPITTKKVRPSVQSSGAMDPFNPNSPLAQRRSVYFSYDSYVVEDEYQPVVQMHAQYLTANGHQRVRIEGNTDARGSSEYNLALGQRRSVAVAEQLIQQGVNSAQIEAVSFGKERPAATGTTEEAYAENRRADFTYVR